MKRLNRLSAVLALSLFGALNLPAAAQVPSALAVQGPQGTGTTATKPPVRVGLKDQTGKVQDTAGTAYGDANVSPDSRRAVLYRFSASFTPQATAAVTLVSVQGSATKTARVKRLLLCGHSTADAQEIVALQRTSALGAGGTVVAPTAGKMDTTAPAATVVVQHYTTTLKAAGTAAGGPLATRDFWTGVITTPDMHTPCQVIFPEMGGPINQSIVLRGAADFLELQNVNAGNLSAGTVLQYTFEIEEE